MSEKDTFEACDALHWKAALSWAADCVEHLSERVGDTPNGEVASCVTLARNYAQSGEYDSEHAPALASEVKRARTKLSVGGGGDAMSAVMGFLSWDAMLETMGWRRAMRLDREGDTSSGYAERERQLKSQLRTLLKASEALCGVDAHAAARDASAQCRRAESSEAEWQQERLASYLEAAQSAAPNPAQAGSPPAPQPGSQPAA
jgi:hypothetical protein